VIGGLMTCAPYADRCRIAPVRDDWRGEHGGEGAPETPDTSRVTVTPAA
jgi:hypothetical protein